MQVRKWQIKTEWYSQRLPASGRIISPRQRGSHREMPIFDLSPVIETNSRQNLTVISKLSQSLSNLEKKKSSNAKST